MLPILLEWAPLFTALATICLPLLPLLGMGLYCAFASIDDLTHCFPRPAALHAFSSPSSSPPRCLSWPSSGSQFRGNAVAGWPDFVSHTPAAAMTALLTLVRQLINTAPHLENVETGPVKADLHFALYCTPYYGYIPEFEIDFIAMTFTLADFLVYTCFTTDSEPNAALSNLSVRPGDLS